MGAGLGGVCRWAATAALTPRLAGVHWATLLVNVIGALAIGVLVAQVEDASPLKLLWITGFLGGFTTFSAFSLETFRLIEQKQLASAGLLILGSVVLCVGGAGLGYAVARMVSRS